MVAKAELAAMAQRDRLATIHFMVGQLEYSLYDAKGLATHLSREGDLCARCNNAVSKGETGCSNCGAANLNWLAPLVGT
jgi:hypothetical protein